MQNSSDVHLGQFLKDKRQQLNPQSLGIETSRRRTPGLRREEVAARAHISVTWYTWLEQGRGGTPSAEVLARIAKALLLNKSETEYLFLTTLGRLPEADYHIIDSINPALQQILDALDPNPALIRNLTWDVLAWNKAAARVLTDYSLLPVEERNVLYLFFTRNEIRCHNPNWQATARLIVSAFRADLARLGGNEKASRLIEDLSAKSEAFTQYWQSYEVHNFDQGVKQLHSPDVGELSLNYSSFVVAGSPELSLVVYTPQQTGDRDKLDLLVGS